MGSIYRIIMITATGQFDQASSFVWKKERDSADIADLTKEELVSDFKSVFPNVENPYENTDLRHYMWIQNLQMK